MQEALVFMQYVILVTNGSLQITLLQTPLQEQNGMLQALTLLNGGAAQRINAGLEKIAQTLVSFTK